MSRSVVFGVVSRWVHLVVDDEETPAQALARAGVSPPPEAVVWTEDRDVEGGLEDQFVGQVVVIMPPIPPGLAKEAVGGEGDELVPGTPEKPPGVDDPEEQPDSGKGLGIGPGGPGC